MKTVTFSQFNKLRDDENYVLIDEETVPMLIRMDYIKRNYNVEQGKELCDGCEGTGNQFYTMYQECQKCEGKGYKE